VTGEPLGQRERRLDAARRRGGDRDRQLGWYVAQHILLDAVERYDLQARAMEEVDEDAAGVDQCSAATRCFGISFLGSMNGMPTTTASLMSP
jgi:hypothetical protein